MKQKSLEETVRGLLSEEPMQRPTLGAKHNPKKSAVNTTLGALEVRKWSGNQKRTPQTYNVGRRLAEAKANGTKKALKKVMEKEGEKPSGKTDTGQAPESVDFRPFKPELTTNH